MHLLLLLLTALNATDHTDPSIHPSPCSLQYTEVESFLEAEEVEKEEMINFLTQNYRKGKNYSYCKWKQAAKLSPRNCTML